MPKKESHTTKAVATLSMEAGSMAIEKTEWHKDPRTWELVQMLIKCRDALPAITEIRRQLYNVPHDLDTQIERLIEPWCIGPIDGSTPSGEVNG